MFTCVQCCFAEATSAQQNNKTSAFGALDVTFGCLILTWLKRRLRVPDRRGQGSPIWRLPSDLGPGAGDPSIVAKGKLAFG